MKYWSHVWKRQDPTDSFALPHTIFLGVSQQVTEALKQLHCSWPPVSYPGGSVLWAQPRPSPSPCPVGIALTCLKNTFFTAKDLKANFPKRKKSFSERNLVTFDIYKSSKPSHCWYRDEQDSNSRGRGLSRAASLQPRLPHLEHFGLSLHV